MNLEIESQVKRYLKLICFLVLACLALPAFSGIEEAVKSDAKRESLRQIAFNGRCAVFVSSPFREVSPSLTEVEVWRTCWGGVPDFWFGTKAGSDISLVRVDCGTRQFATVEYATFEKQFWQGNVLQSHGMKSPLWKPLTTSYKDIQHLCLPNSDTGRSTTAFDGPESKASE